VRALLKKSKTLVLHSNRGGAMGKKGLVFFVEEIFAEGLRNQKQKDFQQSRK
jgi:hypothetical protein